MPYRSASAPADHEQPLLAEGPQPQHEADQPPRHAYALAQMLGEEGQDREETDVEGELGDDEQPEQWGERGGRGPAAGLPHEPADGRCGHRAPTSSFSSTAAGLTTGDVRRGRRRGRRSPPAGGDGQRAEQGEDGGGGRGRPRGRARRRAGSRRGAGPTRGTAAGRPGRGSRGRRARGRRRAAAAERAGGRGGRTAGSSSRRSRYHRPAPSPRVAVMCRVARSCRSSEEVCAASGAQATAATARAGVAVPLPRDGGDEQGGQHRRYRVDGVHERCRHAGYEPEEYAREQRGGGDGGGEEQRVQGPVTDAGEQVAAEGVGTEGMVEGGRPQPLPVFRASGSRARPKPMTASRTTP